MIKSSQNALVDLVKEEVFDFWAPGENWCLNNKSDETNDRVTTFYIYLNLFCSLIHVGVY